MNLRRPRTPALPGPVGDLGVRLEEPGRFALLIGASAIAAAFLTLVAYKFSPLIALALPIAVAAAALVFLKPMAGVYLAVLAMPLERLSIATGAAAQLTPAKGLLVLVGVAVSVRWIYQGPDGLGLTRERPSSAATQVWAAFTGLLLVMALGVTFAPEPFAVAKLTVQFAAFAVVAIYVSRADAEQIERVFMCFAISGGILGAIAATTSGSQTLVNGGDAATGRAQGGFDHPALLAFYLVLAFPPAAVLAVKGTRAALRPLWALCAALAAAGIVLSLTRSAMIALVAALLALLFLAPFRRWAAALLVVVLVFAVFNARAIERSSQLEVISSRLSTISKSTESTAANQRPYIWSKTPAMIFDHPFFGVGATQYRIYAPRYDIVDVGGAPFIHAHDVPLTIAAENGIVGLAFLVWFGIATFVVGIRAMVRGRGSPRYYLVVGAFAAILGFCVVGLPDNPWSNVTTVASMMIVLGTLLATARLVGAERPVA
jgi:putative inorganic carbon (hco3(-)) transporter